MAEEDQEVAALSRAVTPRNQGPRETDGRITRQEGGVEGNPDHAPTPARPPRYPVAAWLRNEPIDPRSITRQGSAGKRSIA
eukprot:COSAG06_NODE_31963_length_513_cov_1.128019_1_plen_80_part_10